MEKTRATRIEEKELPPLIGDDKLSTIKRKPVAVHAPVPAHISSKEVTVEPPSHHDRQDTFDSLPPRPYPTRHPHNPIHTQTFVSRLRTRWSLLTRRTRILLITAALLLLALIIGLSAGLSSRSRTSNLPLPTAHGGPYTGDLTYYDPALGACGYTNSGEDSIVAVSHIIFDAVSTSSNPNANPLCGKKIRARREGKSVDLTVVDRCTGCKVTDIDTTRGVFGDMAEIDEGRVSVTWSWLEDVPGAAAG